MIVENRLKDKVIIITGAASGFGLDGAVHFAREGAKIVIADINEGGVRKAVEDLAAMGLEVSGQKCDVSDPGEVKAAVEFAVSRYGKLDGIWNNAGIQGESDYDIAHCPVNMIDRYLNIDVKGVWYGCHFAAPELVKTRGVILNTASIVATLGTFGQSCYGPSKGAVQTLTYTVAWELGRHGVRCNCISPYCVATPGTLKQGPELLKLQASGTVQQRLAEVDEVVNAAAFMFSDASSGVTGFDLRVDIGSGTRTMPWDIEAHMKKNPYTL